MKLNTCIEIKIEELKIFFLIKNSYSNEKIQKSSSNFLRFSHSEANQKINRLRNGHVRESPPEKYPPKDKTTLSFFHYIKIFDFLKISFRLLSNVDNFRKSLMF